MKRRPRAIRGGPGHQEKVEKTMLGSGYRAFKPALKRLLSRFGLYVGRLPGPDTLEQHLLHLFTRLRVNCVLDVGAFHGTYGRKLRNLGYQGRIVSFEPVSASFDVLARTAQEDGNWQVHHMAMGASNGIVEINVLKSLNYSSIRTPNDYGLGRFGDQMEAVARETVPLRRLQNMFDSCVANIKEPRVFLKSDTQGYALEVLKGAGARLKQLVGLQVELSVKQIYKDMSNSYAETLAWLQEQGFEFSGLYPVSWDRDGLRVVEFDCVMCGPAKDEQ
jgi:FkbM family methyltransferase